MAILRRLTLGSFAGLIATAVMDQVTSWIYQAAPDQAAGEGEATIEGAADVAARRLLERMPGVPASGLPAAAGIHWLYGLFWGGLYGLLAPRLRLGHWYLGTLPGMFTWVVEDAITPMAVKGTPNAMRLPVATHLRYVIGRLAFGTIMVVAFRGMHGDASSHASRFERLARRLPNVSLQRLADLPLPGKK